MAQKWVKIGFGVIFPIFWLIFSYFPGEAETYFFLFFSYFGPEALNGVCTSAIVAAILGQKANCAKASLRHPDISERPPGLIKHVLIVLVVWSGVLAMPHLPSFIQEPQIVPLN